MNKKVGSIITVLAATSLVLTACGGGSKDTSKSNVEQADKGKFPTVMKNDKEAIKGGTLKVALVTDSPFKGIFSQELASDGYDSQLFQFNVESLFSYDENFLINDNGMATLKFDEKAKTATIKLKDDLKWSDGEPLTSEDILFSYEVLGSPEYTDVRYDDKIKNVVGIEDFHDGKTDKISGIEIKDAQTVVITYKEVSPSMLSADGGIWSGVLPKHYLSDVPVKDMVSSDKIRKTPVTAGPFVANKVVAGESVEFVPNKYYYKGMPKLDKIVVERVTPDTVIAALENGKYDVALKMPTDVYDSFKNLKNITLLGREELSYSYIGFKLGKWDSEKREVVTDPNAKMADVKLRQAMGYALNNDEVGDAFYYGLRENATTLVPPVFSAFQNKDIKGYTYDPDKANKLLDEAGYKDVDGDGIREDKDGKKLTINFASMSGGATAQEIADYYIQSWLAIGLKVEYSTGRLIEFNSFYDKVQADDKEIDIFQAAWGTGTDPTPTGLYGRDAKFNFSRFASKELDGLLDDITSEKSFDSDYRKEAFDKWQEYMFEQAPVIPTLYRYELLPVNNRVKGVDWTYGQGPGTNPSWEKVELTADKAEKAKK